MSNLRLNTNASPSLEELKQTTRELMATLHTLLEQSWQIAQLGAEISEGAHRIACGAAQPQPSARK